MSIIGISGPARSGKDTLADRICEILAASNIKCEKTSFAKQLKIECKDFIYNTLGIDVFTENDDEKNIIRPMLVTWGTHVRRKLDPDIWVKSVEKQLKENTVTVISDVRFENEFNWIKDNNGFNIFVDRVLPNGELVQPANDDERNNTIPLREKSDHFFVWNTIENDDWLSAIALEVLYKTIPEETLNLWKKTYV